MKPLVRTAFKSALLSFVATLLLGGVSGSSHANVFTRDSRTALRGAQRMEAPYRWTGRLLLPDGYWCSATLVHRDLVLTAAHCLREPIHNKFVKGVYRFQIGYEDGKFEDSARVTYAWWGALDPARHGENDWALLKLDTAMGDIYGWMEVSEQSADQLLRNHAVGAQGQLGMTAFSKDFMNGRFAGVEQGCHFNGRFAQNGNLLHDCSQTSGSSGAAIYRAVRSDGGDWVYQVVGVNASGIYAGATSNYGVPVPYDNARANLMVPTSRFLPKLKALIAASQR